MNFDPTETITWPRLLSTTQVAKILGLHEHTIRKMVIEGELHVKRGDKRFKFGKGEILGYLLGKSSRIRNINKFNWIRQSI